MTSVKVVDASAAASYLFREPEAAAIKERLEGARLLAPSLFAFELANVCLVKCRRQPHHRAALLAAFQLRHSLCIEEIAVDHDATLTLASQTGLTAYDASYLWLARQSGAELVTLDKKLAAARP